MSKYVYESNLKMLLKSLKASRSTKEKAGWSDNIGCGFVEDDIISIEINEETHKITVKTHNFELIQPSKDYNLREVKEMINWVEKAIWREKEP